MERSLLAGLSMEQELFLFQCEDELSSFVGCHMVHDSCNEQFNSVLCDM